MQNYPIHKNNTPKAPIDKDSNVSGKFKYCMSEPHFTKIHPVDGAAVLILT